LSQMDGIERLGIRELLALHNIQHDLMF